VLNFQHKLSTSYSIICKPANRPTQSSAQYHNGRDSASHAGSGDLRRLPHMGRPPGLAQEGKEGQESRHGPQPLPALRLHLQPRVRPGGAPRRPRLSRLAAFLPCSSISSRLRPRERARARDRRRQRFPSATALSQRAPARRGCRRLSLRGRLARAGWARRRQPRRPASPAHGPRGSGRQAARASRPWAPPSLGWVAARPSARLARARAARPVGAGRGGRGGAA
jgi:hypothetical protein